MCVEERKKKSHSYIVIYKHSELFVFHLNKQEQKCVVIVIEIKIVTDIENFILLSSH